MMVGVYMDLHKFRIIRSFLVVDQILLDASRNISQL